MDAAAPRCTPIATLMLRSPAREPVQNNKLLATAREIGLAAMGIHTHSIKVQPSEKVATPRAAESCGLTAAQVQRIEQALAEVGAFGEVHLVVQRGQLRFINKMKSEVLEP